MSLKQHYRHPVGYEDKIYMISHETLWSWSEQGGLNRWILLQNPARDLSISPNGKYLAFTGSEDSKSDVYIIELKNHTPVRKTFYGDSTYVVGWFDSETVIYATNYELPFKKQFNLFKLNINTNKHEKIPCGQASWISWNSNKKEVIQRLGYGYNNWREYKGGTVADLWIKKDKFEKLPFANSNALKPMWVNDSLYFLSDYDGCGNIYQYNLENSTWSQKTKHNDFYVKDISKYDDKILYSKGGDIYTFNPSTNEDVKLNIEGPSYSFEQNKFDSEENTTFLTHFNINNQGDEVSCAIRGKVYSKPLWNKGYKIQNENIRCRISLWNHESDLVTIQDQGDDSYITLHNEKNIEFKSKNIGRIKNAIISSKNCIAAINNRSEIWIIDINTQKSIKIVDSGDFFQGMDWSPDGKWIVYSRNVSDELSSLFLFNIHDSKTYELTAPEFKSYSPKFDPSGEYIFFLSFRDLKTEFDPLSFNLHFKDGTKPYAISLQEDNENPFKNWIDIDCKDEIDDEDEKSIDENEEKNEKTKEDEDISIDLKNIQLRCFASTIKPNKYTKLISLENKLMLTTGKKVEIMNFNSSKLENICSDALSISISQNKKWMMIWNNEKFRVGSAGNKFDDNDTSYKKGSWVSIEDIIVSVDPVKEWKQIFTEVWWLTREHFWNKNMNNINWDSIQDKYIHLIDKIKSRSELNTILADMIGELKTSHAYVLEPGDVYEADHKKLYYLGAKFEKVDSGFKIIEIYRGDNWKLDSPLNFKAKEGDIISNINGYCMKNENTLNPHSHLISGNNIITLNGKEDILVKPLNSWNKLSYQNWIKQNVKIVKNSSEDIGYVHIPNMVQSGFEEFYSRYIFEHHKAALIVDARYNSGGFLSSLILDKLQRKRSAYSIPRHGSKSPYPHESPSGPMVLLCNENTGSDGDIFTKMFKELKLGPVIGKRTWGGVVGIMPRYYLIDGGLTSQPEFGTDMKNGGTNMENQGVDPDIEIGITPEEFESGHDPQLEKAIEILKQQIFNN